MLATASAQFPNFPGNDSTVATQKFSNYYSYDDGSAEAAYGPTGAQARLAIKYTAYEVDSLIGMNMHFVPSVNDVSNNLFLLTVWDDNDGIPGTVLYKDESFFPRQPIYSNDQNGFITYYFKDTMKVAVGQTFFVGWKQFDAERLNIGLDRNLDNKTETYYSINNGVNWSTSNFDGSVMIRPIFSTAVDAELGVPSIVNEEISVSIYPNPTSNSVTIDVNGANYEGADLYSTDGRLIISAEETKIDMSSLPNGIYFIRLKGLNTKAYKVIKN